MSTRWAPLKPQLEMVPGGLKEWEQWVVWRLVERGDKLTKVPCNPSTGTPAAVNNPYTWAAFPRARQSFHQENYAGLAFVLTPWCPFTGIDLDHCRDEEGRLTSFAQSVVDHFVTYTEWSPSGSGLHLWIRGKLPPNARHRKEGIELYDTVRCLTVTGHHLEGTPLTIEERQEELDSFYRQLFKEEEQRRQVQHTRLPIPTDRSDADLVDCALRASNGARFSRLWRGDVADYQGNHSSADLALCRHLAFWTGGDAERMDDLFRQSGLMREKWDEPRGALTYGQITIAKALSGW